MAAPSRLYPLREHAVQRRLMSDPQRFKVVPAGRRSGKTELAKRKLVVESIAAYGWDVPRFFAGAPTRDQAKAIYWNDLKAMVPRAMLGGKPSESSLVIPLVNGAELCVVGLDKPQRIEGSPWNGGILDEFANMKPGVWGENVRPALSDRRGWCWLIGVPEGRNHYYQLNQYALSGVDPEWASYTWKSIDILDPEEVAAARRQLDPLVFEQEYEASFINFSGRAYYNFLERTHTAKLKHDAMRPLIFCFDFNVDPGVAVVAQEQLLPGQFERDANGLPLLDRPIFGTGVIGEVWIPQNSTTPAVCRRLLMDWAEKHKGEVHCYGDATGGNRGSAKVAGSDWDLIKATLRHGSEDIRGFGDRVHFHVKSSNPTERARINAMNTRLKNRAGEVRMMVDPTRAPRTVTDLEGVRLLKGGSGEIDKKYDLSLTHLTDGLGYYVQQVFPITQSVASSSELRL